MSTESIFEQFAAQQGWNLDSQVSILLRYIENQGSDDAFEDFLKQQADEENEGREENTETSSISANFQSADSLSSIAVDLETWFKEASDKEIKDLAKAGWKLLIPAGQVAEWAATQDEELGKKVADIHQKNLSGSAETLGFELSLDVNKAMLWLAAHRPELHAEIAAIQTA